MTVLILFVSLGKGFFVRVMDFVRFCFVWFFTDFPLWFLCSPGFEVCLFVWYIDIDHRSLTIFGKFWCFFVGTKYNCNFCLELLEMSYDIHHCISVGKGVIKNLIFLIIFRELKEIIWFDTVIYCKGIDFELSVVLIDGLLVEYIDVGGRGEPTE